ncbi:MAG TPA: lytic transglycosylase domain-containing protein [Candidatus Acidoferrales bacterium]|nr:lytic transglycosylase domain-containing protein [Candidatus Acidoferrales bacterium]
MKFGYKLGIVAALIFLASLSASAANIAILRNGFAIRHERREARDTATRLYLDETPDNYIDVPTADIVRIEELDSYLPPVVIPAPASGLDSIVSAASKRNNLDPDLVNSLILVESGFDPNAVSPKGARGLMQLMPQTAAQMGVQNAMDPAANVEGGTRYLGALVSRYHNDLSKALAAYNAGPDRVEQYHGVPPYPETQAYVARIIGDFNRKKDAQRRQQPDPGGNRSQDQNSVAAEFSVPGQPKVVRPDVVRYTPSANAASRAAISDAARLISMMNSFPQVDQPE